MKVTLDHLADRTARWLWSFKFADKKNIRDLQSLTSSQFEQFTATLFEKLGYKTEVLGGPHDGGIDVSATKDGRTHYIQCKKYITGVVPVSAVRDFYGAISDKMNAGGYFITTNIFTADAEKFAQGKPLELIDRFELLRYMKLANMLGVPHGDMPICPQCGSVLVEREGKYGKFFGCSAYPKCSYTVKI